MRESLEKTEVEVLNTALKSFSSTQTPKRSLKEDETLCDEMRIGVEYHKKY